MSNVEMGPVQCLVFKVISDHPEGLSQKDLIAFTNSNYGNLGEIVRLLTHRGYVERIPDPTFKSKGLYRVPPVVSRRKGSKIRNADREASR